MADVATRAGQVSLWEAVLPEEVRRLPEELARVDALLDDPVFFAPFVPFFDPRVGRPSTPMETYLRLMFLKFRYRLGYESLCREVSDSITWRRFCRIPLMGRVPHPTTLMKLTTRCGSAAVDGLNEALLAKAAEAKLLRTTRLRVVYHRGAGERRLPDRFRVVGQGGTADRGDRRRIQAAGGAARTKAPGPVPCRPVSGRTGSRRSCGCVPRPGVTRRRPRCGGSPASWPSSPRQAASDAERLLRQRPPGAAPCPAHGRTACRSGGADAAAAGAADGCARAVNDLVELLDATRRIAAQTRQRVSGYDPRGATRRVSLHDPDARPIAKGRLGKPVEFGYKAQVVDNDDGVVLDHTVEPATHADAPQLAPAVERVTPTHQTPPTYGAADRGYGEKPVDDDLHALGVRTVVIPRKGRPGKARQAEEHRPAFRRTVKWRTGSEGRISSLKRGYGWDRSRLDGTAGARTWAGHGVLAHNLIKISALAS